MTKRTDKQKHAAIQNWKKGSAKVRASAFAERHSVAATVGRSGDRRNVPITLPHLSILDKHDDDAQ